MPIIDQALMEAAFYFHGPDLTKISKVLFPLPRFFSLEFNLNGSLYRGSLYLTICLRQNKVNI